MACLQIRARGWVLLAGLALLPGAGVIPSVSVMGAGSPGAMHAGVIASSAFTSPGRAWAGKTMTVRTYLVAIGDAGRAGRKIGCGDSLVAVSHVIPATLAPLAAAMRLLLSDHRRYYGQSGLYNALYQSRLQVQRATVVNGSATVYLVGTMRLGGVCDDPRVGAQLRQTVRQFSTVRSVSIFVNAVPLWKRLSEK